MKDNKDLKLAVLIDADNIPYSNVKGMLNEIAKFGIPTIKRIYGDWTKPTVSGWKSSLLENAITPIQQYSYTTGKNATDSAMIIDAMDILHSERSMAFVLFPVIATLPDWLHGYGNRGCLLSVSVKRKLRILLSCHVINLFIWRF